MEGGQAYRTLRQYEGTLPMISVERLLLRAPLPERRAEDASSWESYLPAELKQGQGEEDGASGAWAAEMSGQALKIQVVESSLWVVGAAAAASAAAAAAGGGGGGGGTAAGTGWHGFPSVS